MNDDFAALIRSADSIPRLFGPSARTLVRDRFERLVSSVVIPCPVEEVWNALVIPQRVTNWFATSHRSLGDTDSDVMLDFDDGEFFLVRTMEVQPLRQLRYVARWLGIGQATSVTWSLHPDGPMTEVRVTEEAENPPWDWQTWNGGGWPGILDQLAAHIRTGTRWRWPWRRMGPYVQIELPIPFFAAWDTLFGEAGPKYWLLVRNGRMAPGVNLPITIGDASGNLEMAVEEVMQPGEQAPSFLPWVSYKLGRSGWGSARVPGRIWLEPAGWGRCLLQAFHYNWESLPEGLQLSERRILAGYWMDAARRALQLISMAAPAAQMPVQAAQMTAHNW
jgi:uncharacterized protein YndB with AHSA1/START domain